ncbi:oligoribonuclease, mitochondrial-like [Haliotis rufescens]|uniref:oligoribonuclease, mitochondrial-like n=1 Tax=Haliotis rufescens TaxID=6454 RepID=UPI00201F8C6D|nr:oligoribonuclease, mitochondrial-like [Haliotis rufescens]
MLSNVVKRSVSQFGVFVRQMSKVNNSLSATQDGQKNRILWIDLEMTGLNVKTDQILEIACLVTDAQLNIVAEGPSLVIHHPDSALDAMDDWCTQHHGKSGLTEAVKKSKITLPNAEEEVLQFATTHTLPGVCPLGGNSVHADKVFLTKYMPRLANHLHYRIIDVSTVKELCRRWYPEKYEAAPRKKLCHRALDDIKESIEELKYYRSTIFRS